MQYAYLIAYFFGGAFLANAVPHYVGGAQGRAFQSPFAKPPGKGLSSATVNVLWGFFNLIVAYFLLVQIGSFDLHSALHITVTGVGALLMSLLGARHFGQFHGGNRP